MTNLILFMGWATAGLAASTLMRPPGEPRWALAPLASILGPLWIPIALERRSKAPSSPPAMIDLTARPRLASWSPAER